MVKISVLYKGSLNCVVTHGPSGQSFSTDAPLDNHGKAEFISPTDMLTASLASCIATIMGIRAEKENIDLKGLSIEAEKEMASNPRRIGKVTLNITYPRKYTEKEYRLLETVPDVCPVTKSLHPDLIIETNYLNK
jgi:putative redox protein